VSHDGAHGRYAGGSVAGGRYQLRDLLGKGGMASVHPAYDVAPDRQAAVTTLPTEPAREESLRKESFHERFRRAAQAVATFSHCNPFPSLRSDIAIAVGHRAARRDAGRHGAMPGGKALKAAAEVPAITYAHGLKEPAARSGIGSSVTPAMDALVARALNKNPNERFASASATATATATAMRCDASEKKARVCCRPDRPGHR
jgi:serine/threonine protein kinase